MKKTSKSLHRGKRTKDSFEAYGDDLLVQVLNQKVAEEIHLSRGVSPTISMREMNSDSSLLSERVEVINARDPEPENAKNVSNYVQTNTLLLEQLQESQTALKECREEYQRSLSSLKSALASIQESVARRNEEVKGVLGRCIKELEALTGFPDVQQSTVGMKDVLLRVIQRLRGAGGDSPGKEGLEGKETDRSALDLCKARLDLLKADFQHLKDEKTRSENDFRTQNLSKNALIRDLTVENQQLRITINELNNTISHENAGFVHKKNRLLDEEDDQREDGLEGTLDLPLQMRCFSAVMSPVMGSPGELEDRREGGRPVLRLK